MAIKGIHEVTRQGRGNEDTWDYFTSMHNKAHYTKYMKEAEDEAAKPGRERSLMILDALKSAPESELLVIIVCAYGEVDSMYYAPATVSSPEALGTNAHLITWDPKGWWKNVEGLYPEAVPNSAGGTKSTGFFLDYFGLFHELGHCYQCLTNPVWYNEMVAHAKTEEGGPTWCNWLIEQLNINENEHFLTREALGRFRPYYTSGKPIQDWVRDTGAPIVEAMKSKAASSGGAYFSNYRAQNWSNIRNASDWWALVKEEAPPPEVPKPLPSAKEQTPHKKWPTVQTTKGIRSTGLALASRRRRAPPPAGSGRRAPRGQAAAEAPGGGPVSAAGGRGSASARRGWRGCRRGRCGICCPCEIRRRGTRSWRAP